MNYLKAGLRVKLGLTNPYQIKPNFKLFQSSENNAVPAKLLQSIPVNYDTHILRFDLLQPNKCLGIKIGQYAWININGQSKPYVPISSIDQPGIIDFLIRDLTHVNPNSFTTKLLKLKENDEVKIQGPGTQFIYNGYGKIQQQNKKQKVYKNIGIITHASGITTTYSLIQSIAMNYDSSTGVSLLWLGDKEEDFVFKDEFTSYVEEGKLNMNLMLTKYEKGWVGPYGKVIQQHINDYMPPNNDDTFVIMSALQGQLQHIKELVENRGYKNYIYV